MTQTRDAGGLATSPWPTSPKHARPTGDTDDAEPAGDGQEQGRDGSTRMAPSAPTAHSGSVAAAAAAPSPAVATARPQTAAAPTPWPPGGPPDPGGDWNQNQPGSGSGWPATGEPIHRLHVGWHTAPSAAFATMQAASNAAGVLLGIDRDQQPVPVDLFSFAPTRITLVGGAWAAGLVAMRALAFNAQIVVVAAEPSGWRDLGFRATGRHDRVTVHRDEPVEVPAASAQRPVLVIRDPETAIAPVRSSLERWQTELILLRRLTPANKPSVQDCDLLLTQRLGNDEASLIASVLRLGRRRAQLLQVVEAEILVVVGAEFDRYVWTCPTSIEHQCLGPAGR